MGAANRIERHSMLLLPVIRSVSLRALLPALLATCALNWGCSGASDNTPSAPAQDSDEDEFDRARDLLELRRQLIGTRFNEIKKVAPQVSSTSGFGSVAYRDGAFDDPEFKGHVDPQKNWILEPYLIVQSVVGVVLDVEFYNDEQRGKSKSTYLRSEYYGIWGIRSCELLDDSGEVIARVEWSNDRRKLSETGVEHLTKSAVHVARDEQGQITSLSLPDK
jgi:hypothetical protein